MDIVTIDEVASILKLNRKTVRNLLHNFRYRKIGRVYRIQLASVIEWMEKGEQGADAPSFWRSKYDRKRNIKKRKALYCFKL